MISFDYMITSGCNLNCPYCYGSQRTPELSLEQKIELIKGLSHIDNVHLIISGGEPLSSPDIINICSYAKELGLKIALQTNGTHINKLEKLLPFIDWIGLPIDGISADICKKTRTMEEHFYFVKKSIEAIEYYKNKENSATPYIKIGTVITKYNFFELKNICSFLKEHNISIWKIYKIRRRGKMASDNLYKDICTSNEDLAQVSSIITKFHTNFPIYYSDQSVNDSYIIIEPNSDVIVIKGNERINCGNLFPKSIFNLRSLQHALQIVNIEQIHKNINKSFPSWQ